MNVRLVFFVLGWILLILAIFMGVCLSYAVLAEWQGNQDVSGTWLASIGLTLLISLAMIALGFKQRKSQFFRRDAIAVAGLGWVIASAVAAIPFMVMPQGVPFWDGFFEAVSGFTTSGGTIFKDLEILPDSIHLWRALTQWIGGLGIVVLFVAIFGAMGIGGRTLFHGEASPFLDDDVRPKIQMLTLEYLKIYLVISMMGVAGLCVLGMSVFDSVIHTMAAISTGGFSNYNSSVGSFSFLPIHLWLVVIMILGGIGFPIHFIVSQGGGLRAYWKHEETRWFIGIIFFATLAIFFDLIFSATYSTDRWYPCLVDTLFSVTSIITTSGFCTANFDTWPPLSKLLLLWLMIIGGCACSTAGGIKVARGLLFLKISWRQILLSLHPRRVIRLSFNQRFQSEDLLQGVVFYVALYFFVQGAGILGLAFLEPSKDLVTLISAPIACFNNIGPGLAEVGPVYTYAHFGALAKMWLSMLMLLGRLEIFALLVLVLPSFWKKF